MSQKSFFHAEDALTVAKGDAEKAKKMLLVRNSLSIQNLGPLYSQTIMLNESDELIKMTLKTSRSFSFLEHFT